MEFNEKLQELRKQKGLTQEELAEELYVSRTAVSKWESGRGYPNIESLKAIAKFFSVTVDELLSSDEVLLLAEADGKQKEKNMRDLLYGLLDISTLMLIFLPMFAERSGDAVMGVSLLNLSTLNPYLLTAFYCIVILTGIWGATTLALQNCRKVFWIRSKTATSLSLGAVQVLLFALSLQPYATAFAFVLLVIKAIIIIKR